MYKYKHAICNKVIYVQIEEVRFENKTPGVYSMNYVREE